jgi:ATP-dependent DNA helicase PIF1
VTVKRTIVPEAFTVDLPGRKDPLTRKQVPLILSYAMSIHKAQGQSLDRVIIDLRNIFEKGQSYVALSRAKTPQNLQVLGFEKSKVFVHPRVLEFHRKLDSVLKHRPQSQSSRPQVRFPF